MKYRIFTIVLLFVIFKGYSQYNQEYIDYVDLTKEAKSCYNQQKYIEAGNKYSEAFKFSENLFDAYNAACSYALAGKIDASFDQLKNIYNNYSYYDYSIIAKTIKKDDDLNVLHSYVKWNRLIEKIEKKKEIAETEFDKSLIDQIQIIDNDDQKYRLRLDSVAKKYGKNSTEIERLTQKIIIQDNINLSKVEGILKNGWVSKEVIGPQGCATLFLVIQHANLKTQEKYLPLIKNAVKNNDLKKSDLAFLIDRIAIYKGKKQVYGTQLQIDPKSGKPYILPLISPKNVNQRRRKMDLPPIEVYTAQFGINWSITNYKKQLNLHLHK